MGANVELSFSQILELVKKLPGEQKIKLFKELEKEAVKSKLTELLTSFRADDITLDEITEEVEEVRQGLYDRNRSH